MLLALCILAIALVIAVTPIRRSVGSESLVAFGFVAITVIVLFQVGRLA